MLSLVTPGAESQIGVLEHPCGLERLLLVSKRVSELHLHLEGGEGVVTASHGVQKCSWALTCQCSESVSPGVGQSLVHCHLAAEDAADDVRNAATAAASSRQAPEQVHDRAQNADDVGEAPSVARPPPARTQSSNRQASDHALHAVIKLPADPALIEGCGTSYKPSIGGIDRHRDFLQCLRSTHWSMDM